MDVTMGAYDGAEISENIGLYLLSEINKIEGIEAGLYRDDGLAVSDLPKRVIEHRVKSKLIDIFKENDLKIVVDTNLTIVNFLNVTFNLENRTFKPYRKPDNENVYYEHETAGYQPVNEQILRQPQNWNEFESADQNIERTSWNTSNDGGNEQLVDIEPTRRNVDGKYPCDQCQYKATR